MEYIEWKYIEYQMEIYRIPKIPNGIKTNEDFLCIYTINIF